jgi:hypothetical protein
MAGTGSQQQENPSLAKRHHHRLCSDASQVYLIGFFCCSTLWADGFIIFLHIAHHIDLLVF